MNIFEKDRDLPASRSRGLGDLPWPRQPHLVRALPLQPWTPSQNYTASWAIAGLIKLVIGVLLFSLSRRLSKLFGGDLGSGGGVA